MAEVNKVMTFTSADGLANLSLGLRELSSRMPVVQKDLAAIAAAGGQMGIVDTDALKFVETVSKISVAFDINERETGQAVAKLSNIFKIPIQVAFLAGTDNRSFPYHFK